jgi:hypothetical protein
MKTENGPDFYLAETENCDTDIVPYPLPAVSRQWVRTNFERKYLKEERLIKKCRRLRILAATLRFLNYSVIKKNTY